MGLKRLAMGLLLFAGGCFYGKNEVDVRQEHYDAYKDIAVDTLLSYSRPEYLEVTVQNNQTIVQDWDNGKKLVLPPNLEYKCLQANEKSFFDRAKEDMQESIDNIEGHLDNAYQWLKEKF